MLATWSSVSSLPSWWWAMRRTASSSVAMDPSWKYGPVLATLRRLGTLNTYLSASFPVTLARPMSSVS